MKRLVLVPNGWPCSLNECPSGALIVDNTLAFKSEYRTNEGKIEAYNEAGEFLCVGSDALVQPVNAIWEEYEP